MEIVLLKVFLIVLCWVLTWVMIDHLPKIRAIGAAILKVIATLGAIFFIWKEIEKL